MKVAKEGGGSSSGAAAGRGGRAIALAPSYPLLIPGCLISLAAVVWFSCATMALFGVHALPAGAAGSLLATLQQDPYYALLLPLTIPVALVAVHLSWFSLKLYRHS